MEVSKEEPRRKAVELVASELEAAEVLAGLAHGGASVSGERAVESVITPSLPSDQVQAIAAQQFRRYTTVETRPIEQLCSTSYKSNFVTKLMPKLTNAEKEERKLRRILANRESARQTIRRRQAMHQDLTKKAAQLSEENENLKKRKELAVNEYNTLRDRNEYLKAQMAKLKKDEAGETIQKDRNEARAHISETSNNPVFPHNQTCFAPNVWPSILPYTDLLQLQYMSRCHVANSSLPFVVVPVPWLLPIVPVCSHLDNNEARNVNQLSRSDTILHGDNIRLSENRNTRVNKGSNSTRPMAAMDSVHGAGFGDQYTGYHPRGHESMRNCPLQKNKEAFICPTRNPEDALAAVEARRRRKELMRLKNTNDNHNN